VFCVSALAAQNLHQKLQLKLFPVLSMRTYLAAK